MLSIGRAIFFSLWHQERTPTLFHPDCKALMGSHALSAWETATNELIITCVWWKHMKKKWQTLVTMLFLFIMAKILAFQTKTTHPSLVSMSANRAEDDRRDMKCRWSNRRGGQARQQQGGKTQTEPKGQSQDRGRKETRRCRGSARGDVPGEGEQGRAS